MADTSKRVAVIAIDGSVYAEKAFQWYLKELYREGDHVIMTYVLDHRKGFTYGSAWVPTDATLVAEAYQEEERKAEKVVEKLKSLIADAKVDGEVIKTMGDPGHKIVEIAGSNGASFIITGNRGMGTIRRTLIGSVSDYVLHHSTVPVFICRH